MSETEWLTLTSVSDHIGFSVSVIANATLLIFLTFKKTKALGTYKYLMMIFAFFSIVYTMITTFKRPLIHVYDNTVFVIQQKRFNYSYSTARYISAAYCFCYAFSFTFSTVSFVYRYFATCKTGRLVYFQGAYFFIWMICVILASISWGGLVFVFCDQTERTRQSLETLTRISYGIDPMNVEGIPYHYYSYLNGTETPFYGFFVIVAHHLSVMFISFGIIISCGLATYKKMQEFKGISDQTRDLQRQLFIALVLQTLIPTTCMYIPLVMLATCAMFGLNIGVFGNLTVISVHLYPGFDPLVLLFLIKDYRKTLMTFARCGKLRNKIKSSFVGE